MAWFDKRWKTELVPAAEALPGRAAAIATAEAHFVTGRPLKGGVPEGMQEAYFALGCFWGAERLFWETPGVWLTAAGYMNGHTPNPAYEEVCTGATGHAEAVRVVFDPAVISYEALLKLFFEAHDPTQGMRQGGDVGTQYRSGIYVLNAAQQAAARAVRTAYDAALKAAGKGAVTTEIAPAGPFFYAEDYHQQYLARNPGGYCGLGGTGVACPVRPGAAA